MKFVCMSRASFLFCPWRRMSYPSAPGIRNCRYQFVIRKHPLPPTAAVVTGSQSESKMA